MFVGLSGQPGGYWANEVFVTTPFGFWFEQEMVDLTVKLLDRSGAPAIGSSFLDVTSIDDAWNVRTYIDGQAEIKMMRVPVGTYSLTAMVSTLDAWVSDPYGLRHFPTSRSALPSKGQQAAPVHRATAI